MGVEEDLRTRIVEWEKHAEKVEDNIDVLLEALKNIRLELTLVLDGIQEGKVERALEIIDEVKEAL
jgi:hypothetical protein